MTDFFGDDFTAELKAYFLDSLLKEADSYVDLIDDSTWKRIRSEFAEHCASFAVDAKTNEFTHLSQWLESFPEKAQIFEEPQELMKAIKAFKGYVEQLIIDKKDSAELSARFILTAQSLRELQYLHCFLGEQEFAIPLLNVVEISSNRACYPLPEKRHGISGVIPFRGEAVPVISFSDHGFHGQGGAVPCYVICEQNGKRFSLEVTKTEDLVSLKEADIQNFEPQATMISTNFAHQFFIKEKRSVMILDLEKMVA